jgi:hypothetical protein
MVVDGLLNAVSTVWKGNGGAPMAVKKKAKKWCPSKLAEPACFCDLHPGHVGPCSYHLAGERANQAIARIQQDQVAALKKVGAWNLRDIAAAAWRAGYNAALDAAMRDMQDERNNSYRNIRLAKYLNKVHAKWAP